MDKKANEAYCYYKQQLPDTVCLFRLEDAYVAICDDAAKWLTIFQMQSWRSARITWRVSNCLLQTFLILSAFWLQMESKLK